MGVGSHAWFFLSQLALHSRKTNFSVLTLDVKVRACQFRPLISAELTPLANFLANAFCRLPLESPSFQGNSTRPLQSPKDRVVGGGFFQVCATQAHYRQAYLAESAAYNPYFRVLKLPTTPNWVVPNAVCTDVETTLPLPSFDS